MYAEVLIEYGVKSLDKTFTYSVPKHLSHLKVGMKVVVSFGKQTINGFVVKIKNTTDISNLKPIISITDETFILNDELLALGNYLNETTLCSLITAYQTMLPSSLKVKEQKNNYQLYDHYLKLNGNLYIDYLNKYPRRKKAKEIIDYLLDNNQVLKSDFTSQILNDLIKSEVIEVYSEQKVRIKPNTDDYYRYQLTEEQQKAINQVSLDHNETYLIHGVTGSGKTEVYLRLIETVIKNNKTALMLVPEISLTAQVIKQFYDRFGYDVAVFHSGLSAGEKYDEYLKIYNNQVKIVVGTRSAIFTPLNNIGIIIIDEEHSESYKQDNNPRYQAIQMAKFRAEFHNCPLIFGSATPTLESYARAIKGVYHLIEMNKRIGLATMPNINLIDMNQEMKKRNMIISTSLKEKIIDRLEKNEQIIILLNRRGYSTIINCQSCGYTYECPSCGISLTYHKSSNLLRCHYCGYQIKKPDICPSCHEDAIRDYGLGTEKLEKEINQLFPLARTIRMDADTTTKKGAHKKIINDFFNNDYDILLGTQMIAKGLDFPKVSLVGVINADMSLKIPDFRSNEKTFQLLSQVSGRSGRSNYPGEVLLQTFNPENKTLNYVKNNDYQGFYQYEMNIRRQMSYPPYYFLISIKVTSKIYEEAAKESNKVVKYLKTKLNKEIILGPTTASIFKLNNIYRFQIIIKYREANNLVNTLKELTDIYKTNNLINIEVDFSPSQI